MRAKIGGVWVVLSIAVLCGACSSGNGGEIVCYLDCGYYGYCEDWGDGPECICDIGYTGMFCDACDAGYEDDGMGGCQEISGGTCEADTCSGHGSCDDSSGTAVCTCDAGYDGLACDTCAAGYHPFGLNCLIDETCEADTCSGHGTCDDSTGVVVCTCDGGYDGDSCDACAGGWFDMGAGCEEITACDLFPFADDAYVFEIFYAKEADDCCFDLDNDGENDNDFGVLLDAMEMYTNDPEFFNLELAARFEDGSFCRIFDFENLDSLADDEKLLLSLMPCQDSDGDYANNLSGDETFTVGEDAFLPDNIGQCSSVPRGAFDFAWVDGGELFAYADHLDGLLFPVPFMAFLDMLVPLRLEAVSVEASLASTAVGPVLNDGAMGGAIRLSSMVDALNDAVVERCACLGLDGPLVEYTFGQDGLDATCRQAPDETCDAGDPCLQMVGFCTVSLNLMNGDVDLDGDGVEDAMSVGLFFSATSASVSGITP